MTKDSELTNHSESPLHNHQRLAQSDPEDAHIEGAASEQETGQATSPDSGEALAVTEKTSTFLEHLSDGALDAAITELATVCQPAEAGHRRGLLVSAALSHTKVLIKLFGDDTDRGKECSMVRTRLLAVKKKQSRSFGLLFFTGLISNFDTGVLIAGILDISTALSLNHGEQGNLIGVVYFGIFLATMPAALLMEASPTGQRLIVATAMLSNCAFNVLFAAGQAYWQLMLLRVGVGATQAVLTVYAPVWIDYFGAHYMPLFQACAPLGIVAGYLTTGFTLRNLPALEWIYMWRWPFMIQSVLLLLVSLSLFALSDEAFNVPRPQDTYPGSNMGDNSSIYLQFLLDPTNHKKRRLKRFGGSCAAYTCVTPLRDEISLLRVDFSDPFWREQLKQQPTGLNCFAPNAETDPADALSNVEVMVRLFKEGDLGEYQGYFEHHNEAIKYLVFNGEIGDERSLPDDEVVQSGKLGVLARICILMSDGVFVCFVASLTFLYYVVTGIQSWITEYLVAELHAPFGSVLYLAPTEAMICEVAETVVAVFGATAITAPVCGVLTCATVVDRFIGGYQSFPQETAWFALLMATFAVVSAVGCCLVTNFWHLSYLIWLLLFFGGSIVPAATGLFQDPADKVGREFANAFAQVIFAIFGYMGAPVITGWVMEAFGRKTGMQMVFLTSVLSLIFLVLGLVALKRQDGPESRSFHSMTPESVTSSDEVFSLASGEPLDFSGMPTVTPTPKSTRIRGLRYLVPTTGSILSGLDISPHETSPKFNSTSQKIEMVLDEN